jgi:hypothetical protein
VSVASPHLNKFLESGPDGLGGIFNVRVPDLVGSKSGHFQLIILKDINCHQTLVVSVGLVLGASVIHVAL